jgi:DNA-nicking Smr family endonuclease
MDQDDDEPDATEAPDAVQLPIEPVIDLHSFAPADIPSLVDEYLTAAHAAGLREVRLIHGRGRGHQRARVQSLLERHALVLHFWDAPESHLGATVAQLID